MAIDKKCDGKVKSSVSRRLQQFGKCEALCRCDAWTTFLMLDPESGDGIREGEKLPRVS